jgi:hypothetical protein
LGIKPLSTEQALIGGGGEVPFIKGMEREFWGWRGSFSPWRKRGKGIGGLLERFF